MTLAVCWNYFIEKLSLTSFKESYICQLNHEKDPQEEKQGNKDQQANSKKYRMKQYE